MTNTQVKQVEHILLRDHKIDNFFCINTRLTTRLAAIIYILRQKGYEITTARQKESKNTIYFLLKRPKKSKKRA